MQQGQTYYRIIFSVRRGRRRSSEGERNQLNLLLLLLFFVFVYVCFVQFCYVVSRQRQLILYLSVLTCICLCLHVRDVFVEISSCMKLFCEKKNRLLLNSLFSVSVEISKIALSGTHIHGFFCHIDLFSSFGSIKFGL